jgi:hypothetical protein
MARPLYLVQPAGFSISRKRPPMLKRHLRKNPGLTKLTNMSYSNNRKSNHINI